MAITGTLSIASTSLGLVGEEKSLELATTGVIKCTYASETEDKADVDATGNFTLSCKAGKPMVISYFDTDGNPTCSIIFKVDKKDTATATISQDVDMKKISCADGSASVDLDTLAPAVAKAQTFTQDASVTLINQNTDTASDHWEFTVEKQAMIGADGKAGSTTSSGGKSRKKTTSLAASAAAAAEGPQVGQTINMAFLDTTCNDDTKSVAAGIVTVLHQEESGEGGGNWECIDGASITWTGKSFSISLTQDKDVASDLAKHEIDNQRPQQETVQFQQVGTDGKPVQITRDPNQKLALEDSLALEGGTDGAAPDTINVGMNFPLEAYCRNTTKWNKSGSTIIDTAALGTPCTNFANFKFVDFGKFCSQLKDTAGSSNELAKNNVMQCSATGGTAPTPSNANKNDPQCDPNFKDFDGHDPVEDMGRGVDDLRNRLALIVKINDLAQAGDATVVGAKSLLAEAVTKLTASFKKVQDQITIMKAAVAQIKANRITRCTATTQTPQDQSADRALYAKMDGRVLQPLFNEFQQLFNQLVNQNPPINNLFRQYVSAPTNGFDGTACVIPTGADTTFNFSLVKPTGTCKFTENVTIAGVFKDAKTLKPMQLTFMDKPNGDCNLSVQHIAFDTTTGCWTWDGLKPKLTSESVDKTGMFNGGLIQRMKLMGTATLTED